MYLRDLDDDLLINAVRHYVATAKDNYPPSVPALRKAASDLKRLAANVPTAFEAWENLREVGNGEPKRHATGEQDESGRWLIDLVPVSFCHPLVETVARQLGWPKFPSHDDVEIDRAHFFKAYDAAITKLTDDDRELPSVTAYIDTARQAALPGMAGLVKKLEDGR
jgi:hypothetical protein